MDASELRKDAKTQDDRVTIFTLPDGICSPRKPKENPRNESSNSVHAALLVSNGTVNERRSGNVAHPLTKSSSLASKLRRRNAAHSNGQTAWENTSGTNSWHFPEVVVTMEPEGDSETSEMDSYLSREEVDEVSHSHSANNDASIPTHEHFIPRQKVFSTRSASTTLFHNSVTRQSSHASTSYRYLSPRCKSVLDSERETAEHCVLPQKANAGNIIEEIVSVLVVDSAGQPLLSIRKDPTTGKQRTIVRKDDGSERAFGYSTVQSCVDEAEDTTLSWLASLTIDELKALLNEFYCNAAESSKLYHETKSAFDKLSIKVSYSFFDLQEDASEKELDNAYRQQAKRMHPDKNGGTREAKENFQLMKEHYEAIKRHRSEDAAGPQANKENCDNRDGKDEKVAQNRDEQQASLSDLLAETNRDPLDQVVWQMINMLKNIRSNMRILQVEQDKLATRIAS